ncbi:MAG: hypothetical protein J6X94_10280 [Lachnospiraceae bacterium]|nr:hypothetical protein [Lachnospiraceae bacterium]
MDNNKWTPKRICAILVIIFLVMIYVMTLVVAIVWPGNGAKLFAMCLFATVIVPIVAYAYIWVYSQITGKRTIASVPKVEGEELLDQGNDSIAEENSEDQSVSK